MAENHRLVSPQDLAHRLDALSEQLKRSTQQELYTPSSKESCIAACRNFIRLTWGFDRLPVARGRLQDLDSSRDLWSAVWGGFQDGVAEYDYKMCLAECIDDQSKRYSQNMSNCVVSATSKDELDICQKLVADYQKFSKLEKEIRQLELKLADNNASL